MALYDGCEKQFGGAVDIFCNNAGINHLPGWRKCMDIDIVSSGRNSKKDNSFTKFHLFKAV